MRQQIAAQTKAEPPQEEKKAKLRQGLPNSTLAELASTSRAAEAPPDQGEKGPGRDLEAVMQAKAAHMLGRSQPQRPIAEQEADRLSRLAVGATPETVKASLGQRLGADFSGVRFHQDETTARRVDAMDAAAYTAGEDIYFGSMGFDPALAAHELIHTAQQGAVQSGAMSVSAPLGGIQQKGFKDWLLRRKGSKQEADASPEAVAAPPAQLPQAAASMPAAAPPPAPNAPSPPAQLPQAAVSMPAAAPPPAPNALSPTAQAPQASPAAPPPQPVPKAPDSAWTAAQHAASPKKAGQAHKTSGTLIGKKLRRSGAMGEHRTADAGGITLDKAQAVSQIMTNIWGKFRDMKVADITGQDRAGQEQSYLVQRYKDTTLGQMRGSRISKDVEQGEGLSEGVDRDQYQAQGVNMEELVGQQIQVFWDQYTALTPLEEMVPADQESFIASMISYVINALGEAICNILENTAALPAITASLTRASQDAIGTVVRALLGKTGQPDEKTKTVTARVENRVFHLSQGNPITQYMHADIGIEECAKQLLEQAQQLGVDYRKLKGEYIKTFAAEMLPYREQADKLLTKKTGQQDVSSFFTLYSRGTYNREYIQSLFNADGKLSPQAREKLDQLETFLQDAEGAGTLQDILGYFGDDLKQDKYGVTRRQRDLLEKIKHRDAARRQEIGSQEDQAMGKDPASDPGGAGGFEAAIKRLIAETYLMRVVGGKNASDKVTTGLFATGGAVGTEFSLANEGNTVRRVMTDPVVSQLGLFPQAPADPKTLKGEAREAAGQQILTDASRKLANSKNPDGTAKDGKAKDIAANIDAIYHRIETFLYTKVPLTITVSDSFIEGQHKEVKSTVALDTETDKRLKLQGGGGEMDLGDVGMYSSFQSDHPERTSDYMRFRFFKDQVMGEHGLTQAEAPVFAAFNTDAYNTLMGANIALGSTSDYAAQKQREGSQRLGTNNYGSVHLLLKRNNVMDRVAFTATDHGTLRKDPMLALYDFFNPETRTGGQNSQAKLADYHRMSAIISAAESDDIFEFTGAMDFEAQIMGQIDVARDVEAIYADKGSSSWAKVEAYKQSLGSGGNGPALKDTAELYQQSKKKAEKERVAAAEANVKQVKADYKQRGEEFHSFLADRIRKNYSINESREAALRRQFESAPAPQDPSKAKHLFGKR